MRIKAAIRMLKDRNFSNVPVAKIGERSGFDESGYFGKVFRKNMGCSPGFYAKNNQNR